MHGAAGIAQRYIGGLWLEMEMFFFSCFQIRISKLSDLFSLVVDHGCVVCKYANEMNVH